MLMDGVGPRVRGANDTVKVLFIYFLEMLAFLCQFFSFGLYLLSDDYLTM